MYRPYPDPREAPRLDLVERRDDDRHWEAPGYRYGLHDDDLIYLSLGDDPALTFGPREDA